ncbi:hypothetical protein Rxycam_00019 [Rubrobacter xylanophilus DSM 9941]|uniref:anti-sigma factor family protein n=1 Tax=Rubrobacter xylanophilus TaxID=49319 RepID=UPI001C63F12E|nr:zf-HC2 domain-containing protein [Rubrobacter xylanophilus]QYJ14223.1 hypothetical protein Rxycam_00019 [Rubrobacter xylanophilus DSM 9941]
MRADQVEDLLFAYVAGELTEDERERVERALARSAYLRNELARCERLFVVLAAAAAEEIRAPRDLRYRITWQIAITAYLNAAIKLAGSIMGAYGRAIVYYLRLSEIS